MGELYANKTDFTKAEEYYQRSIKVIEGLLKMLKENPYGNKKQIEINECVVAGVYRPLAWIAELIGDLSKATDYLTRALEIFHKYKDKERYNIGFTLKQKGRFLRLQGKWCEALETFKEAYNIFEGDKNEGEMMSVLNAKAALFKETGDWPKAARYLEEVLMFHQNYPDERREVIAHIDLGDVYVLQGRLEEAKKEYENVQRICDKYKDDMKAHQGFFWNGLGMVALKSSKSDKDKAKEYFEKALECFNDDGNKRKLAEVKINMGTLLLSEDLQKALEYFKEAYEIIENTDYCYVKTQALVSLCDALHRLKATSKVGQKGFEDYLNEAFGLAREGGYHNQLAKLNYLEGCNLLYLDDHTQSLGSFEYFNQACICALLYNDCIFDEILQLVADQIRQLASEGRKKEASDLCDYIIQAWDNRELEIAKDILTPEEVNVKKACSSVITKIRKVQEQSVFRKSPSEVTDNL